MNKAFMSEAIRLSIKKMEEDHSGPFGAIVVKDGEIIGRGWNRVTTANDPTAHAEILAIRDACTRLGTFTLTGCQLYASCEPCPMCLAAIYWARIDQLIYAATRADAAAAGFDDEFIHSEISKPCEMRQLPTTQMMQTKAQAAFKIWAHNTSRIDY